MPSGVEVKSEGSTRNQIEGYRAETLLDYPNLPIPEDVEGPSGDAAIGAGPDTSPGSAAASASACNALRSRSAICPGFRSFE